MPRLRTLDAGPARASASFLNPSLLAAAAAASILCAAPGAQAALTGTLVPGLGYEVALDANGNKVGSGFMQPSVVSPMPNGPSGGRSAGRSVTVGNEEYFFAGTQFLGGRGVAITPEGARQLAPLGTSNTGFGKSSAQGADDTGAIAGTSNAWSPDSTMDLGPRPVWYAPGESMPKALPLPPGFTDPRGNAWAGASTISKNGVIVGYGTLYDGDTNLGQRALRWKSATAQPEALEALPGRSAWGDTSSTALAVNIKGAVVGHGPVYDDAGNWVGLAALRWDAGQTTPVRLGAIGTSPNGLFACHASAINREGDAVGDCAVYDSTDTWRANIPVTWPANSTTAIGLGGLGSGSDGRSVAFALGVGDGGTSFGVAEQYDAHGDFKGVRAVRWVPGRFEPEVLKLLSMGLSGNSYTFASGMNRKGWVAGSANFMLNEFNYYRDPDHLTVHAVVWDPKGKVHDLNKLLPPGAPWKLYSALAISDSGLVTGLGWYLPETGSLTQPYPRLFTMQLSNP